jgi:hypothetical protein
MATSHACALYREDEEKKKMLTLASEVRVEKKQRSGGCLSVLEALPGDVVACAFACLDAKDHFALANASRLLQKVSRLPKAACGSMQLVSTLVGGLPLAFRLQPRHITVLYANLNMMRDAAFYARLPRLQSLVMSTAQDNSSYVPTSFIAVIGTFSMLRSLTVDMRVEDDYRDMHRVSVLWWQTIGRATGADVPERVCTAGGGSLLCGSDLGFAVPTGAAALSVARTCSRRGDESRLGGFFPGAAKVEHNESRWLLAHATLFSGAPGGARQYVGDDAAARVADRVRRCTIL